MIDLMCYFVAEKADGIVLCTLSVQHPYAGLIAVHWQ
jgi:hypothetical protein